MEIKNSYFYFQKALTPGQCEDIINLGKNQIEENIKNGVNTAGTTGGDKHKEAVTSIDNKAVPQTDKTLDELKNEIGDNAHDKSYVRDSQVAWLTDTWIYDLVLPFIHRANKASGWNYQLDFGEDFQFTVYKPGGFYGWHSDGGMCHFSKYKRIIPGVTPTNEKGDYSGNYTHDKRKVGKIRKISATINLNLPGEYEGGNLKFDYGPHASGKRYHECTEIRPQGSIVVFPSFIYHQVTPVTKGTRYSLVLWSLGDPFV